MGAARPLGIERAVSLPFFGPLACGLLLPHELLRPHTSGLPPCHQRKEIGTVFAGIQKTLSVSFELLVGINKTESKSSFFSIYHRRLDSVL